MAEPNLGIIEGYFGPPWRWEDRCAVVEQLAPVGYRFFHYAPKGDAFLRRRWQETHPPEEAKQIAHFVSFCQEKSVRVGIGLSPYEAFNDFHHGVKQDFVRRIKDLASLGIDDLGIFFDDMHSHLPDLAQKQIEIMHLAKESAPNLKLVMTPTYYSNDMVLDRVFGPRPLHYLAQLGAELDPAIDMYWTGEEVCSLEISLGHVQDIGAVLGRKPLLWDNYPVNDGPRMSGFLHLRGFTGRSARLTDWTAGHAINPALQPYLTCIPAMTLADLYRMGDAYCYGASGLAAAHKVLGPQLAEMVCADLISFQDAGLSQLSHRLEALSERYQSIDHPAAREIVTWLQHGYACSSEFVQTQ
ncbi:beta-N-acetylglucosaminidase domain-containing protein [Candidatus Phycosocius spiralis]|uniref:Hyaluronidase n=1 Tax=Candidatus Phycosocius spiralis TaxID=2815099 RepID=A0ABQ4PVR3_9PROT|nr:beta-N-acetylglucosaminidase domain-containing protein [Candidatus Phycosocius spiralis]GIU67117.1 hyaluronidase [Candidatus Phycosocius spiralis]